MMTLAPLMLVSCSARRSGQPGLAPAAAEQLGMSFEVGRSSLKITRRANSTDSSARCRGRAQHALADRHQEARLGLRLQLDAGGDGGHQRNTSRIPRSGTTSAAATWWPITSGPPSMWPIVMTMPSTARPRCPGPAARRSWS